MDGDTCVACGKCAGGSCLPCWAGGLDIPELPDKEQLILIYCRSGEE